MPRSDLDRHERSDPDLLGRQKPSYALPDTPAGKVNTTAATRAAAAGDRRLGAGLQRAGRGQRVAIVLAAEITVESPDFGHLEPMVAAARADLDYAGVTERLEVVLADAGYWHQVQMQRLMSDGLQVLIPPDANKRKGERPGWHGGLYDFMRRVLATERGGELYAKRQTMIEPVFAQTKFNRRCDRFLRRGRSACRSEWRLINTTHNLLKLHKHTTARVTT